MRVAKPQILNKEPAGLLTLNQRSPSHDSDLDPEVFGPGTGVDRTREEWGSQAAKTTRQGNQAATTTSRKRTRSDHVKVLDVPAKPLCTDQLPSWDDILMHH